MYVHIAPPTDRNKNPVVSKFYIKFCVNSKFCRAYLNLSLLKKKMRTWRESSEFCHLLIQEKTEEKMYVRC